MVKLFFSGIRSLAVVTLLILFIFCFCSCTYEYYVSCETSDQSNSTDNNLRVDAFNNVFALNDFIRQSGTSSITIIDEYPVPLGDITAGFDGLNDSAPNISELLSQSNNGKTIAKNNDDIVIENIGCIEEQTETVPLRLKKYLKSESGSDNKISIYLSENIKEATIIVTACSVQPNTTNRSIDIVNSQEESCSISGAVLLNDTYAWDESASDTNLIVTRQVVAEVINGEYFIFSNRSQYIVKIEIAANLKTVSAVEQYTLAEQGMLPVTSLTLTENNKTYIFTGWVNQAGGMIDYLQPQQKGTYNTVYVSVESCGTEILINEQTALCFRFSLNFYNSEQMSLLSNNQDLKLLAKFNLTGSQKQTYNVLKNYAVENESIIIYMAVYNIPSTSYEININASVAIEYTQENYIYESQIQSKNIADSAKEALSDLSSTQTGKYINEIIIEINQTPTVMYSPYTNEQIMILQTLVNQ